MRKSSWGLLQCQFKFYPERMKYLNPGSGQLDFNLGGEVVTNVGIIVEKMHVFRTTVKADLSGTG